MINKEVLTEKFDYFLIKKIKVHITKINKEFHNGYIIEKEGNVYLFNEDVRGKIRIFINEVFDIEEFKGVKNDRQI